MTSVVNFFKKLITPSEANAGPNPAQMAMKTAPQANAEAGASVFSAGENCNNTASSTVVLSSDYRNAKRESWTDIFKLNQGDSASIGRIMNSTYGHDSVNAMTEGEKNSAMWSIVDNNRWMIEDINDTYEMAQVSQHIQSELQAAYGEEEVPPEVVVALTEYMYSENEIQTTDETGAPLSQENIDAQKAQVLEDLGLPEDYTFENLEALKTDVKENVIP